MFGYRRSEEIAAEEFERGVEAAINVMVERGHRTGGTVDARLAEVEIRAVLLREYPVPQHDEPRSR